MTRCLVEQFIARAREAQIKEVLFNTVNDRKFVVLISTKKSLPAAPQTSMLQAAAVYWNV